MGVQSRLEKLESVLGINQPCEVCVLAGEFSKRSEEMRQALNLPTTKAALTMQSSCQWCARPVTILAPGFTARECAIYERMLALSDAGEMCLPEYGQLEAALEEAFSRQRRECYGKHVADFEKLYADFLAKLEAVRQPPRPRLCRVPGCACAHPKTLDEWRANVRAKGFRVAA